MLRVTWHDPESSIAQAALTQSTNGYSGVQAVVKRAGNLSAAGTFLWPIPERGIAKRIGLILAPTLVVVGESDKLIPATYGDAVVAAIRDASVCRIADAGHAPMLEQPQAFLATVEPFLAG